MDRLWNCFRENCLNRLFWYSCLETICMSRCWQHIERGGSFQYPEYYRQPQNAWFKICLRWRRRFNAGNQIRLNQCISGYFALLNISKKHSHQIWIGVDLTWFFIKPAFREEILRAEWGGSIYLQFPVNTRWPLTVDKMRLSCLTSHLLPSQLYSDSGSDHTWGGVKWNAR